jgi:hypothetical protein
VGKAVIVSWVTVDEPGSSNVIYWSENSKEKKQAKGKVVTYKFYNYTSGFIHHTTIRKLKVSFIRHTITLLFSYNCFTRLLRHDSPVFVCPCSASI